MGGGEGREVRGCIKRGSCLAAEEVSCVGRAGGSIRDIRATGEFSKRLPEPHFSGAFRKHNPEHEGQRVQVESFSQAGDPLTIRRKKNKR